MPAALHVLAHYLMGAWAAYSARHNPKTQPPFLSWPLALAAMVMALFTVPCSTYQFRFYPDHALGYALSPQLYPAIAAATGPLSLLALVANVLALGAGFAVMQAGVQRAAPTLKKLPIAGCLALGAWALIVGGDRIWHYGTDTAYWANQAASFGETPSAWLTLLAYGLSFLVIHRTTRHFIRKPWHLI